MKVHFVNSAFVKAPERALFRHGRWRKTLRLRVRYGILEHPRFGPVLIDTGYDRRIITSSGRSIALRAYSSMIRPVLQKDGDIQTALGSLGYGMKDVQKVIVTHFHADHVAALRDFPEVEVIADKSSLVAILNQSKMSNLHRGVFPELLPKDLLGRITDIARQPVVYAPLNLGKGRDVFADGSVIAVDLPGHAAGHFGLSFPDFAPVLLYACDVQWVQAALSDKGQLPLLGRLISENGRAARHSIRMVSDFRNAGGAVVLCHDPKQTPYDLGHVVND